MQAPKKEKKDEDEDDKAFKDKNKRARKEHSQAEPIVLDDTEPDDA